MSVKLETLLEKIPQEWRCLIGCLGRPSQQLTAAETWYTDSCSCGYSHRGSWTQLLQALTNSEPIVTDGKLEFRPLLVAFPPLILRLLLAFIHHHCWDILPHDLKSFTELMMTCNLDPWSSLMIGLLISHTTNESFCYKFSDESQPTLKSLFGSTQEIRNDVTMDVSTSDIVSLVEMQCDSQPDTQPDSQPNSHFDSHPAGLPSTELVETHLSTEQKAAVCRLREMWMSQSDTDVMDDLKLVYLNTPHQQVSLACDELDFSRLHDEAFLMASRQLVNVITEMSLLSRLALLKSAVLTKLEGLDRAASRTLLSALHSLTVATPVQMTEAVLLPVITSNHTGPHQVDVVVKLVKESLDVTHCGGFIRLLCCQVETVTEIMVPALLQLLEHKLVLDSALLTSFIALIDNSSSHFTANVKFGKLLVALINCCAKQLETSHHLSLNRIIDHHQSFMKKRAMVSLKKIAPV